MKALCSCDLNASQKSVSFRIKNTFPPWGMKLWLRKQPRKKKGTVPRKNQSARASNWNGRKGEQSDLPCVRGGWSPLTTVFLREKWVFAWKAGGSFGICHWFSGVYIKGCWRFLELQRYFGQEELIREKMNLARKWKQDYILLRFAKQTLKELLQFFLKVWKHVN